MELILKEDIIGLGFKNDIVNVKSATAATTLSTRERLSLPLRVPRRCWPRT